MRNRNIIGSIALAALLSAPAGALAQEPSKLPDWSGQWKRPQGIGIQWDQSKRVGPPQQAPLTPEFQAIYEAGLKDQAAGGQGLDPTGTCISPGMPRMMTIVFPMEFVITPATTYLITDYTPPRRIFTDGRSFPEEIEPTMNGYSIGKWVDPDSSGRFTALEVETRAMKGPRSYEASGIPLHPDNASIVKERLYRDKDNKDMFHDEITTIDHALTRPWTVTKNYVREQKPAKDLIWYFNECSENNRHVWVGKDTYFVSDDGYLMPTKKGQAPPDLRFFKEDAK